MRTVKRTIRELPVNPNTIIEHELASMHPKMSKEDYTALKLSIESIGQKEPIMLYRNLLVDGRHRLRACKELGIDVKVCDFSSNAKISDIKDNVMASEVRRHESKTQKAIQAFNSSLKNKMTYHVLAQQFGVNEKLIKYVSFIYNKAKRPDILDKLLDNHLVSIEGRKPTDSLSAVAKALKEEMEKDIIRDESEVVHWSADAYLRTEESKDWYYNQVRMLNLGNNVPVKMLLVELANLKFKREL